MVKVFFELETVEEAQALLAKVAGNDEVKPTKKTKKGKVADAEIEEDAEEVQDTEEDGSGDDPVGENADTDGDSSDEGGDGPTLAEVMEAFKKFVKKHKGNKTPAFTILKKFKAKTPNDLGEKHYEKVIQLLKK